MACPLSSHGHGQFHNWHAVQTFEASQAVDTCWNVTYANFLSSKTSRKIMVRIDRDGPSPHPHHTTGVEYYGWPMTMAGRGVETLDHIYAYTLFTLFILNGVGQTKEHMYDSTCRYFPQSTGTLKACKHWLNLVCFLRVSAGTVWGWDRLPSFACENFFARWSTMATSRRK